MHLVYLEIRILIHVVVFLQKEMSYIVAKIAPMMIRVFCAVLAFKNLIILAIEFIFRYQMDLEVVVTVAKMNHGIVH